MSDILLDAQVVLLEAGFSTRLTSMDDTTVLLFEDEAVSGFINTFDDPSALLNDWKTVESALLLRFSRQLRQAGDKAWNVYSVFLCREAVPANMSREIAWIEENLDRTRKIAACGISARHEVERALLPILPLQNQPGLDPEDVTGRLLDRVRAIAPAAADAMLDDEMPPLEVVRLVEESL